MALPRDYQTWNAADDAKIEALSGRGQNRNFRVTKSGELIARGVSPAQFEENDMGFVNGRGPVRQHGPDVPRPDPDLRHSRRAKPGF